MVIDTSALVAILLSEPEERVLFDKIRAAPAPVISAVTYLETGVVMDSRTRRSGADYLDSFLINANITIVPITEEQARLARDAYRRFGKGFHPARLNLGDCFAYALAKQLNQPLLFKGVDFSRTDIVAA